MIRGRSPFPRPANPPRPRGAPDKAPVKPPIPHRILVGRSSPNGRQSSSAGTLHPSDRLVRGARRAEPRPRYPQTRRHIHSGGPPRAARSRKAVGGRRNGLLLLFGHVSAAGRARVFASDGKGPSMTKPAVIIVGADK